MLGEHAIRVIEEKQEALNELSMKIWNNPEIGWEEEKASAWTAEFLRNEGFTVEENYTGLPTAIKAVWGSGKPVVGFLGEYDALPGMSQKVTTTKEEVTADGHGQGCGHNILGVAHVAAALGLKAELEAKNLPGTVIYYGCPAEETLTGKGFMARGGAFKELDIHFAWHPAPFNLTSTGTMAASNGAKFHFKGITAHAGADPHKGRSALDAAELMNIGANYLREHVTDDVRIHYSYVNGGEAPNVVPDKASTWYYVRALSREAVVDTCNRLIKIANGAAMMTETEVEVEYLGGCYNTLQNRVLLETVHATISELPMPTYTEEEIAFAKELNKTSANFDSMVKSGRITPDIQLDTKVPPIANINLFASTDVGDVQHIAPGVTFMTTASNIGAAFHSWHITASSGASIGKKGMLYGGKVMAISALKAILNPEIIENAQKEFQASTADKPYDCPIPADLPVPGKKHKTLVKRRRY